MCAPVHVCVRLCCQLVNARCTTADKDQKDITNNRLQTGERDTQVLPRKSLTPPSPNSPPPHNTTHSPIPPTAFMPRGGHSIASCRGCMQLCVVVWYRPLLIKQGPLRAVFLLEDYEHLSVETYQLCQVSQQQWLFCFSLIVISLPSKFTPPASLSCSTAITLFVRCFFFYFFNHTLCLHIQV